MEKGRSHGQGERDMANTADHWTRAILAAGMGQVPSPGGDLEGCRCSLAGTTYLVQHGILRQERVTARSQEQTKEAFGFKWQKRDTYESPAVKKASREWLLKRYFGGVAEGVGQLLRPGATVLDAGCGSGFSALLLFGQALSACRYLGVDISTAVDVARQRFQEEGVAGEFLQADLMDLPFRGPTFDVIFSEGVLHHTDSTERAIKYLAGFLNPGGTFLFYVYNKKGPIREFVDDYVRDHLRPMDDQQAWDALMPLTKLGEALGRLQIEVDVPEAIPFLGIPKGKIDVQRLFYWHILKAYYRPDWSLDEMNHVNFDWYRPANCHRQTPDQVRAWCAESGLRVDRMTIEEAGITVVSTRSVSGRRLGQPATEGAGALER